MPEISRFFGIVASIQYRDHEPAHFHATYGDYEISVGIQDGAVDGWFPKRALRLVQEWRRLHSDALLENWQLARERRRVKPIAPLE